MKKILLLLLSISILVVFISCDKTSNSDNSYAKITSSITVDTTNLPSDNTQENELTFTKLSNSKLVCKKTSEQAIISQIINCIENEQKQLIENSFEEGWEIAISDKNNTISFSYCGDKINYQGKCYVISSDIKDKLISIYNSINSEETDR